MKSTYLSLLLISFLATSLAIAAPPTPPQGAVRAPALKDLAPHPLKSKTYNEFWTYQLRLNNTIDLTVNITRGDFGTFKGSVCGANVTLNNYNGTNYSVAREYPIQNFIWQPEEAKLQVHQKIFFEGLPPSAHHLYFATSKNDIAWEIDISFEQIESSLMSGDGVWKIDRNILGQVIHIPWARVTGSISVDGVKTAVSGTAMMDHTWQDDLAPAIIDRAYRWRTRATANNWEVAYLLMPRSGGDLPAGISLKKSSVGVELRTPRSLQITAGKTVGRVKQWPSALLLEYDSGKEKVLFNPAWSRSSVLDEFSGVTRWAVKKFLGGDMVNDRGSAVINGHRGDYAHTFMRD